MSNNDKTTDRNRIRAYAFRPGEFTLVGGQSCPEGAGPYDTDEGEGTLCYDARILKPLDESDIQDVIDRGVHTAVRARKDGKNPDGTIKMTVVFGRGRIRWARAAELRTGKEVKVPCIFVEGTDKEIMAMLISENQHRNEDHFSNMALKIHQFQKYGASDEECVAVFKITESGLRYYKKYFDLDVSVQTELKTKFLNPAQALQFLDLPRAQQAVAVKELVDEAKANGHTRVSPTAAKQKARQLTGKEGSGKVPLRVATKVIAHEGATELSEGFIQGVRWMLGDLPPERVKGLKAILTAVGGG